ncbi:phosphoglycerate kinase [Bacillus sp. FJAT-27225]|uniref:histidine phosphatase family protein n=1 Tax=Bacillus sp. FJAT-27225 TaxID=1743144 RepID=UPI00080C2410|nr:histidine phosphatase family protein [Bacillus sp. FJAT-27225]OCA83040.1 phosphoglycerate kinase [Bacillus sp. FJAT-27225]
MTKLGFIRHGSTSWNKEGRAQGSSDIPLDQDGLNEARLLAERLSSEEWDIIYSSPLMRARQTAEVIAEQLGIKEIQFDSRLREVSGGQIEGTTEAERVAKWGSGWRKLDLGFESNEHVLERGFAALEDIQSAHPGKNILIVSHGALIRRVLSELVPSLKEEGPLNNTAVTIITHSNEAWECGLYNCTKHLL